MIFCCQKLPLESKHKSSRVGFGMSTPELARLISWPSVRAAGENRYPSSRRRFSVVDGEKRLVRSHCQLFILEAPNS